MMWIEPGDRWKVAVVVGVGWSTVVALCWGLWWAVRVLLGGGA